MFQIQTTSLGDNVLDTDDVTGGNISDPDKKSSELTAKSEVNRSSLLSTDPKETAFVKFRPADRSLESQPSKTFSAQIHESGNMRIT